MRFKPWQLAFIVILLCGVALALARWKTQRNYDGVALLETLPPDRATHVYISVAALRDSGILDLLAGSKAEEEADYRRFVDQTGFDYRSDLDAVAGAFFHGDSYFAARGHFDWKKLKAYALAQGGSCHNIVCSMPATEPGRHVSYYPLNSNTLAIAFTSEEFGVNMIGPSQWSKHPQLPADPVWISAPSFAFTDPKGFPAGAQAFLSPLAQAEHITFAVGPEGQRMHVRLDVSCANAEAAAGVAQKLTATTDLLKKMLEREKMTPNSNDLSGVLVAGTFSQQDNRVIGSWPIERGFITALATGKIQ
ncbi:MAG: hypothetical protein LAO79_03010 [Acidobacteriia bacterium]|nr:hypothetical protein [Terriglobia bacterium]